jgi:hypothetical protein
LRLTKQSEPAHPGFPGNDLRHGPHLQASDSMVADETGFFLAAGDHPWPRRYKSPLGELPGWRTPPFEVTLQAFLAPLAAPLAAPPPRPTLRVEPGDPPPGTPTDPYVPN